jgi:HK97 gp10 family phage protein
MAAKITFKGTVDHAAVIRVIGPQMDRAAYKAAQKTRSRAVANIQARGRVNTGRMKDTIRVRKDEQSQALVKSYTVASTAPYTHYQEFGTRAHGPRRRNFLAFQVRGKGPWVFAKFVRGVTPGHFMRDAIQSLSVSDFMP